MDATIRRLANHVAAVDFDDLPPEAVHECRRRLVDSIACAASAHPEPFCGQVRRFAGRYGGTPAARIWGSGVSTSIEMAAFANGTMVRYLDYSDTYIGRSIGHPSDMLGGLVSLAEAYDRDGRELIVAIVVAYEVYCSLCDAVALAPRGIDQATCAAVGAAAGAARLLRLDESRTAQSLSLALAANLSLYNVRFGELSDWKGCAGPNGARNGVFAAFMAADGVTGPTAPVEGRGGLRDVVGELDWRIDPVAAPRIVATHLKLHPVCYHGQAAVDATLALRDRMKLADIVAIDVETYDAAYRAMGQDPSRWTPLNRETADHSLPYTVAVAFRNGRITSTDYTIERLRDAETRRFMDLVGVTCSAELTSTFPAHAQARVTIRCEDGSVHTHLQKDPKGNASNPIDDAKLESKFIELFRPWGDTATARGTLATLWAIEELRTLRTLVDGLREPAPR